MRNQDLDSLETPVIERTEENSPYSHRVSSDKVIHIETCRNCKDHRHSTWHNEAKYETQFNTVKTAIEELIPGIQVLKNQDEDRVLGGFEIMHGEKVLFSKKTSGLWPNAKAVAQRVQMYFDDIAAGKDVSGYGTQPEKAYTPKREKGDRMSYTSGVQELNVFNPKYGKTAGEFSSSKDSQKQGSEASPKRDENENENELGSERRENEEQNGTYETNNDEHKEQRQEDKEDKEEQVNNHHQENHQNHETHEKHEHHDNHDNHHHQQNPHEHADKEHTHEHDSAHPHQHENKEAHEHNNHHDNTQHENKAHDQGHEQGHEHPHEQKHEQTHEQNAGTEQRDSSPTIPEKKGDEGIENEVVDPKEAAAQDHPMAFMLGAVKGKIASITQDNNKEAEGDKKNESSVKEDYPEDFN